MHWHLSGDILAFLLLAHLAGDFVLQSDAAVEAKRKGRIPAHLHHAVLHGLLAYICLGIWSLWLLPVLIGLTHGVIDFGKEAIARRSGRRTEKAGPDRPERAAIFLTDQLLHIAIIFVAAGLLVAPMAVPGWVAWYGEPALGIAITLIGLIVTTWVGAVFIGFATEPYLNQLKGTIRQKSDATAVTPTADAPDDAANDNDTTERGFPKGGRTIGLLERALVFLFVITGNMTGVGFLVAAKSVFRFGEITQPTQRKEAEYILIGTLMSFTWALFAAWITRGVAEAFTGM